MRGTISDIFLVGITGRCGHRIIADSAVPVYAFSYGRNKLFDLPLFKFEEKVEIKIGTEKAFDDLKKFFLGNVFVGRPLHGL
jgi:hypothetical protein